MKLKPLFIETAILGLVCVFIALIGNALSPVGIPVFGGQWNPEKGTVHGGGHCKPETQEIDTSITAIMERPGDSLVIVDARTLEDYIEGHIPGALSLPAGEFDDRIEDFMASVPLEKLVITYCSGEECYDSHEVAEFLKGAGYENIRVYAGGMPDWIEKGKPVEKGMP